MLWTCPTCGLTQWMSRLGWCRRCGAVPANEELAALGGALVSAMGMSSGILGMLGMFGATPQRIERLFRYIDLDPALVPYVFDRRPTPLPDEPEFPLCESPVWPTHAVDVQQFFQKYPDIRILTWMLDEKRRFSPRDFDRYLFVKRYGLQQPAPDAPEYADYLNLRARANYAQLLRLLSVVVGVPVGAAVLGGLYYCSQHLEKLTVLDRMPDFSKYTGAAVPILMVLLLVAGGVQKFLRAFGSGGEWRSLDPVKAEARRQVERYLAWATQRTQPVPPSELIQ